MISSTTFWPRPLSIWLTHIFLSENFQSQWFLPFIRQPVSSAWINGLVLRDSNNFLYMGEDFSLSWPLKPVIDEVAISRLKTFLKIALISRSDILMAYFKKAASDIRAIFKKVFNLDIA